YMYAFDFALIAIAVVILNVYHPGMYIIKTAQKDVDVEMAQTPAVAEANSFAHEGTPRDFSTFAAPKK
ncbi:hypothetical protein HDU82_003729, partial [Entophlyctis luteolus]